MIVLCIFVIHDLKGIQMMSLIMVSMMAVSICSASTLQGKENLFIYRKTPSGVARFLRAKLVLGWFLVLPIIAMFLVVGGLRFNVAFSGVYLMNIGRSLLLEIAMVLMAMGVSLIYPTFTQKAASYLFNFLVSTFLAIGSILVPDRILHQEWLQIPLAYTIDLVMIRARVTGIYRPWNK